MLIFHEVIGEGVFVTSLELVSLKLDDRRDRVTNLLQKFSAENKSENKLPGEGGAEPTEYDTLMQD